MNRRVIDLLTVRVGADMEEVLEGFDAIAARSEKVGRRLQSAGRKMTAGITLPLAAIGAASFKMASDAEEAGNKFDVVMGRSADSVRARLHALTATIPATTAEMESMAAGIQDMLVPMGIAREEAAGMSADAVKLAGDIASFNNVLPTEALDAYRSALAGESEPMRRFGVDTRVTRLEQLALEEGLIRVGEELDNTSRALAIQIAVQRDSADAIGDAGRTVDSAANQFKFLQRNVKQLGITIGEVLLPAVTPMLAKANQALALLRDLEPRTVQWGIALAGVAAIGGPLLIVLGKIAVAVRTLVAVAAALNVVLATGGIAAMIAGGGLVLALGAAAGAAFLLKNRLGGMNDELERTNQIPMSRLEQLLRAAHVGPAANWDVLERAGHGAAAAVEGVGEDLAEVVVPAVGAVSAGLLQSGEFASVLAENIRITVPEVEALAGAGASAVEEFGSLRDSIGSVAVDGVDAMLDFATGAGNAISSFVKRAISDLARLAAKMLFVRGVMSFLPGVGSFLGLDRFAGAFASGGHIPAGMFGLVAEAGRPEIVSRPSLVAGPAQVTPTGSGAALQIDWSNRPRPRNPVEADRDPVIIDWLMRTFDAALERGYRPEVSG